MGRNDDQIRRDLFGVISDFEPRVSNEYGHLGAAGTRLSQQFLKVLLDGSLASLIRDASKHDSGGSIVQWKHHMDHMQSAHIMHALDSRANRGLRVHGKVDR